MLERLLFGSPVELMVASPLHLLGVLIVLCILAFRAPRQTRLRRWRLPLAIMLAWAWITLTPVLAHLLAARLELAYPAEPVLPELPAGGAAIIVLSSGAAYTPETRDTRQLDLASHRRTLAGVELWQRTGGLFIVTGSVYPNEPRPVAERMAALARDLGVDASAVIAVPGSLNTYENLAGLDKSLLEGRRVFLVTSAMHMPRAMDVARRQGLDAVPVPCDYRSRQDLAWHAWLPNNGARPLFKAALHEWLGRIYYRFRGWA